MNGIKVIKSTLMSNGNARMIIEIERGHSLMAFSEERHYKLGQPVGDVMAGHVVTEARPVHWCSASQEWVDL